MSSEFYNYIANNTISYFQKVEKEIHPGDRFCLKLDNEKMVSGVDKALWEKTRLNGIQGTYSYGDVYSTFTIKLSTDLELVVASKINGMKDDFLATLRNAELTEKHFPILMITYSTIDSITSGTGDLALQGMPFHAASIIANIKQEIERAQLPVAHKKLLELELKRKQNDRYSDKSSIFEYADILTVLGKGSIQYNDYPLFGLFPDPEGSHLINEKEITKRYEENHKYYEKIDNVVKYGNIEDDLGNEYDKSFIKHLVDCKKNNIPWNEKYTFVQIKASRDKIIRQLNNDLEIKKENFEIYSGSPLEYLFAIDENAFIRADGETRAKQRRKNILIYNFEEKTEICIDISTNVQIKESWIEKPLGLTCEVKSKKLRLTIIPEGCSFAKVSINDLNTSTKHLIKICVINVHPRYLEEIQTSYVLNIPNKLNKSTLQVFGVGPCLTINPGQGEIINEILHENCEYSCKYYQTLKLQLTDDGINTDTGNLNIHLQSGLVDIPLQIRDESTKAEELTGARAFILKNQNRKSLEYRGANKIVVGTTEFHARDTFKSSLDLEELIVNQGYLAIRDTIDGPSEYILNVSDDIRQAYIALLETYKRYRTLPSLGYLGSDSPLRPIAENYINAVEKELSSVQTGQTLSTGISDTLLIGCVMKEYDDHSIAMSPLHPLNIMYQMMIASEEGVGEIKEELVEKLTPLYLLPYIKDKSKALFHAIEQKHLPEWRYYVPVIDNRYQGARNFVPKLVCEKIDQYIEHFPFLFNDIGNNQIIINLLNMGDCGEIFQGLIHYYNKGLKSGKEPRDLLHIIINIYSKTGTYNEFHLLSDLYRLKKYLRKNMGSKDVDDINELALVLSSNLSCFYKSEEEPEYAYSHLAFFEMNSSEDSGASRMDLITTGISLDGITSGVPSVLNTEWYKTGFGTQYAHSNRLINFAALYNALFRVAYSGSSFDPKSCIFTEIDQGQEGKLGKIYRSSNWVIFINPKVDLSFFQKLDEQDNDLMIIHYSDQYTSSSGYDDITVTQKSQQYNDIIQEQLEKKGVIANKKQIGEIINLFNVINGGWLLRLISAKKQVGAADSNFSREKMSILSAIKLCMAYYAHPDIVWIPISLEEMLRVSGGAGLSSKDGLLSARNLGFEHGATSDDILMVGIEGPKDHIKVYLHPVEVKIGQNPQAVLHKAHEQVLRTHKGFWDALWPENDKNYLERKLIRNFFIQMAIAACEKFKLYGVYPDEDWDFVLDEFREELLNDQYTISDELDVIIGKGTIVSFGAEILNISGKLENDVCLLELPENKGSAYMIRSPKEIENELRLYRKNLPQKLQAYQLHRTSSAEKIINIVPIEHTADDTTSLNYTSIVHPDTLRYLAADIATNYSYSKPETPQVESANHHEVKPEISGMRIVFGEDITSGNKLVWQPNNTEQVFHTNTGIIGTMGTGKTQFTKSLITQLYREQKDNFFGEPIGILIFDYKGDYNESKEDFITATKAQIVRPYHLPFNPLSLTKSKVFKPLLPIHTANAFKDTLAKIYGLGPKQQNTLNQCIIDSYAMKGIVPGKPATWDLTPPTFDMVYTRYQNDEDIKKNDSLAAVMDKLYQFEIFEGDPSKTVSLFDFLKGVVVVDLSGYDPDIQSLVVAITLDLFYAQMQAAGSSKLNQKYRQLTKFILVDEADNFMSEGFPSLKKILKEGREFGVGTILSTQFLKHFGSGEDDYSKYILTWVVHNVSDLKLSDVDFVFKTEPKSAESQRLFKEIKGLQKHHSIVKIGNDTPKYIKDLAFWELINEDS